MADKTHSDLSEPTLTAREAAARLGVKVETLYAYVSRGMLPSHRALDGRTSLFALSDIDQLVKRNRRPSERDRLEVIIDTSITAIYDDSFFYRGRNVAELCVEKSFEWVAEWLWLGETNDFNDGAAIPWQASIKSAELIASEVARLPVSSTSGDQLRVAVAVAGATHSLRHDLRPRGVAHTARRLIATMVDSLPLRQNLTAPATQIAPLAERLWPRLCPYPAEPEWIQALNAALVLLADHELAASTIAARVAASTRADPYAVVSSGLGVLSGSLHGTVSAAVQQLLSAVQANNLGRVDIDRVGRIISDHLRHGQAVPGFGHPLYPNGDPRGAVLLAMVRNLARDKERLSEVDAVIEVMSEGAPAQPNVDFALAALAHVTGMDQGAGEAIFSVARSAGWIAHAIEEYNEPPNRFRARARYIGSNH